MTVKKVALEMHISEEDVRLCLPNGTILALAWLDGLRERKEAAQAFYGTLCGAQLEAQVAKALGP